MKRKELSITEKRQILQQRPFCFICGESITEAEIKELQFDHIKALGADGSNDLLNYAGTHKKCHGPKGIKSLEQYKEEIRLTKEFGYLLQFTDVSRKFNPNNEKIKFEIDYEKREITFNNGQKAILNRCPNTNLWFFYCNIPREYLDSDVEVQPRGLDQKRLRNLTFSLRGNFQLSPTVCRLITKDNKIKVFDGQHKATAQAIGNQNKQIDCKVFIDPPLEMVRRVVIEGHGTLRQQEFKTAELYKKINNNFKEELKKWQQDHPDKPISEADLPQALSKSKQEAEKIVLASITESIYEDSNCEITEFISEERRPGKKALSYDMFAWWVKLLVLKPLISESMESEKNFREDERTNIIRLFNFVTQYFLSNRWNPDNPNSVEHKKTKRLFYRAAFREWVKLVNETLRGLLYVRTNEAIFFRNIKAEDWEKIEGVCRKLYEHPIWMDPNPQIEAILNSNVQNSVETLFKEQQLDLEYLHKPD